MNKKLFLFLVFLMSLSLIGIIFVQGFWIKNTVESNEKQFSFNAKQILISVSDQIEEEEFTSYYISILSKTDSLGKPKRVTVDELFQMQKTETGDETFFYSNSVIQEDYKLFSPFLSGNKDSIEFKKLINKRVARVVHKNEIEGEKLSAEETFVRVTQMDQVMKELMGNKIREVAAEVPIYKRIDKERLKSLIKEELKKRDMETGFEFGIYSNGLATKIKTENFELDAPSTYGISIFDLDEPSINDHNYQLMVDFTGKKQEILSSIALMASLSIIFTLVIVIAYSSALTQLIRQRQISQIKTDFINNMTHEFKTPIATINLA
ncbi:MAG TPA: two-component sensor histidine kinase, partial [Flavobacteriaceae bacterium]|nr:two-component sensor histidine kinase [Flavobacteriaceae bacterium]